MSVSITPCINNRSVAEGQLRHAIWPRRPPLAAQFDIMYMQAVICIYMDIEPTITGPMLAEAMKSDRMTQEEVAAVTGLSQPTISRYASGTVRVSPEYGRILMMALPTLRKTWERQKPDRKATLRAEAEAIAARLIVPELPAGFEMEPWRVTYTDLGFPQGYESTITFVHRDKRYGHDVKVIWGADPERAFHTIMQQIKTAVSALRDGAAVIA